MQKSSGKGRRKTAQTATKEKKGAKENEAPAGEHQKDLFKARRACFVPLGRAFNHKRAVESERKFKNHGGTVV